MNFLDNTLYTIEISDDEMITFVDCDGVACGPFIGIGDFREQRVKTSSLLGAQKGNLCCVKALGDSMIDAGIESGDMLVIDKSQIPQEGDVVVAYYESEYTAKQLHIDKEHRRVVLMPANDNFSLIIFPEGEEPCIVGVVVQIIKSPHMVPRSKVDDRMREYNNHERYAEIVDRTIDCDLMTSTDVWAEGVSKEMIAVWVEAVSSELNLPTKWQWAEKKWGLDSLRRSFGNAQNSERYDDMLSKIKEIMR